MLPFDISMSMDNKNAAVKELLSEMYTSNGCSILKLSHEKPILLVFLRHFGCTFCREAMHDLAQRKDIFQEHGVQLVIVHMSDQDIAQRYFEKYKLSEFESISDPDCHYYTRFGLGKGTLNQLIGLRTWARGFESSILKGHGMSTFIGDGFQMPGVFLVKSGVILEKFIHKYSSDRPDYDQLVTCCPS